MSRFSLIAGFAALILMGACATATPYQPADGTDWGYSESQIESNRFRVEFSGNTSTDRKTVETYMLYRAAELTKMNGFDHFRVVERDTDSESRVIESYDPYYSHFHLHYGYYTRYGRYYYNPAYWYGSRWYTDPHWAGTSTYREVTRYVASAEILMGKGEKPEDAAYFDAADVIFNLHNEIVRPEN